MGTKKPGFVIKPFWFRGKKTGAFYVETKEGQFVGEFRKSGLFESDWELAKIGRTILRRRK